MYQDQPSLVIWTSDSGQRWSVHVNGVVVGRSLSHAQSYLGHLEQGPEGWGYRLKGDPEFHHCGTYQKAFKKLEEAAARVAERMAW